MTSNLAQQLQRIAATSVNTVSVEKQKQLYSVSLLYTPAQAAAQDLTTVYSIAVEGFRELVELDTAFRKYERSLFSQSSINVDRFVQTKKDNDELNRSIDSFLALVGSRLLLKSAIKVLEWLVRKFRIHEQNTTSLLLTFLPYHGHPVFTRIISIIPPRSLPIALSFLAPHINPPTCPPRAGIIKSLTAHPDFFNLLNTHVLGVLAHNHAHHALVSFYMAVTVEALHRMSTLAVYRKNPEDIIIRVMPTLIQGLKAKKNPEFQIGCYMIITVLVGQLPLDVKLMDSLMASVVQGWSKASISPALACVALLAQERASRKPLPHEAVKGLSKVEDLGQMLAEMGQKFRVDELAAGLAIGILSQKHAFNAEKIRLVEKILLGINMPYARRKDILVKLILAATKAEFEDDDVKAEVAEFFVRLAEGPITQQATKILNSLLESEGLDIETLELRLQTVIRPASAAIGAPADSASAVTTTTLKNSKETFQELISSLPEDITESSFLAPSPSPLLPVLSQAFLQASSLASDAEMSKLFSLPLFSNKSSNEAFTLTFLIKSWTSSSNPVLSRAAALSQANKIIATSTAANIKVDYQALLPYVLIALADQSKKVRSEAANVLVSLNASFESLRKKDRSSPVQIWGFETLFGKNTKQTGDAKWMETTEARKLLGGLGIVDTLEEAVVDGAVVYRTMAHSLGRDGGGLKNSLKSTAMAFLASHVIASSDLSIKLQLLKLVNTVASGVAAKAKPAVTIIRDWVNVEDYTINRTEKCAQDKVDIVEVEKEVIRSVGKVDKGEAVELLVSIIRGDYGIHPNKIGGIRKVSCARLREIWSALKDRVKAIAAQRLLDVSTTTQEEDVDISGEAMEVMRNVNIPVEAFEQWLQESLVALKGWTANLGRGSTADNGQTAKRTKADSAAAPVGATINRLTVVLELLETRTLGEKDVGLLKLAFGVLSEVMNVADEIGVGVGYLLQLILGILSGIVNYIKNSDNPKRKLDGSIRADVLVNCIRSTQSPQVQNRALLLVAALADVAPEVVLHSVMPIFTFMGANVLRQDDEYSAHVIEQTVQRVIPPLVKSLHRQAQASSAVGIVAGVVELVSSFVTAYRHIPVHRRSRLFIKLTDTLGADEFLCVILSMLAEKYFDVGQSSGLGASEKDQEIATFGKGIANAFGEETQLLTVVNYLDVVNEVQQKRSDGVSSYIFDNIKEASTEARATIALKLLRMLASVLDNEKLRTQVGRRLNEGDMDSERIRSHFSSALEKVLALGSDHTDGRLHSVIGLVMENLLALLSTPEFVKVIEKLIINSQFRRNALANFKERVASEYRADQASRLAFLGIAPRIAAILASNDSPVELKADALSCINAVTTKYGKRQQDEIFGLTQSVIGDGALKSADEGLRVLALVCLTDMTTCLAGRILPIVPKVVPFALELLETGGARKNLVNNAVFAFLEGLVNTIPSFMGSYLQKMLKGAWASTVDSEADEESDSEDEDEIAVNGDEVTRELRTGLLETIAKRMDVKAVMGAMAATWTDAVKLGSPAVKEHLATLKSLLSTASKTQVQKMHPLLAGFFLKAFDVRKQVFERKEVVGIDEDEVDEIEELCLATGLQMVMKLNDTIFKPMFMKFSDWAADEFKVEVNTSERDVLFQRSITFYNWLNLLSGNLKSLITEYYSFILTPTITLLTTSLSLNATPTPSATTAFLSALRALTTSFTTDTRDFWTSPVHFTQLSPTLLSSLSLVPISPSIITPLTTSIVELASSCAGSEDQLKTINTSVLKAIRNENVEVRLVAVRVQMKLYEKMGEEWLGFLPETVPYIAELLEDDSEEVERETQRLIGKVEEFLGEGELQGMLQ